MIISKMMNFGRELFLIAIFIIFTIRPAFYCLPATAQRVAYLFVAVSYLVINANWMKRKLRCFNISKKYGYSIMFYFMAIIWATIVILVRNGEFSYIRNRLVISVFCSLIIYSFLVVAIYHVLGPRNLAYEFLKLFVLSKCVCVLITCLFICYPAIKNWWMSIIVHSEGVMQLGLLSRTNYLTRVGLRGFAGFSDTIECSIGTIFCLRLFDSPYKKKAAILIMVMLLGNIFYGRSGLIFSLLIIGGYSLCRFSWRLMIIILGIVIISVAVSNFIYPFLEENPRFSSSIRWVSYPFLALKNGDFSLGETAMFKMYFLPDDDLTILIGDGKYTDSDGLSYYMHTDVGFMRHMLFYGVIGEMLGYLSFCMLLLGLADFARRTGDKGWRELALMFFLLTFFFEIKGDPFTSFFGIVFAICMGIASSINHI